jgi:hypothetical protein
MIESFTELLVQWFTKRDNSDKLYKKTILSIQKYHNLLVLQENLLNLFNETLKDDFDQKRLEQASELMDISAAVIIILNTEEKYDHSQNVMDHLFEFYKDLYEITGEEETDEDQLIEDFLDVMASKKALIRSVEGWDLNEY